MSTKYLWDVKMRWTREDGKLCGMHNNFKVIVGTDGLQGATEAIETAFAQVRALVLDPLGQRLLGELPKSSTPHLVSLVICEEVFDGA